MEPRFNMFGNETGARFSKRFANASLVIAQSPKIGRASCRERV